MSGNVNAGWQRRTQGHGGMGASVARSPEEVERCWGKGQGRAGGACWSGGLLDLLIFFNFFLHHCSLKDYSLVEREHFAMSHYNSYMTINAQHNCKRYTRHHLQPD